MAAGPDVAATKRPAVVCCDQAIFTSIPSPMGRGYRLVACSPGLRPEEKQRIVTRCPSHHGLCDEKPEAIGVSFYSLPTGRLCIGHTCHAGTEHTARGGQRVYTRVVVVEADTFQAFGCNPFNVVRALVDAGGDQPDLKPPASLPPLELCPQDAVPISVLTDFVGEIGPVWIAAAVARVLRQEPVVVLGEFASFAFLEALGLSVPMPLRAALSFSGGIRYSPGRGFAATVLHDPKPGRLRQTLQGHQVALLQPESNGADPPEVDCDWSLMVQWHWQRRQGDELIGLAAERFPDVSVESLQRYGRLRLRRDTLAEADAAGLIALLGEHLDETVSDESAARLAIEIASEVITRLADIMSTAPIEELAAHWGALTALWRRSESTTALLGKLTANVLKRATRLEPLTAAKMAVNLVGTVQNDTSLGPVQNALNDLLDHLVEWVGDQPPDRLVALAPVLAQWGQQHVLADRVAQLEARLASRRQRHHPEPSATTSP